MADVSRRGTLARCLEFPSSAIRPPALLPASEGCPRAVRNSQTLPKRRRIGWSARCGFTRDGRLVHHCAKTKNSLIYNSNSDMRHATLRGLGPGESGTQGRAGVRARGLRGSGCQGAVPGSMRCSPRLHEDRDSRVHTIIISRPPHGQWVRRPRRLGTQSENISRAGGYRRPRNSLPTIPYYTILYHTVSGPGRGRPPPAAQARRRRFKVRKAR